MGNFRFFFFFLLILLVIYILPQSLMTFTKLRVIKIWSCSLRLPEVPSSEIEGLLSMTRCLYNTLHARGKISPSSWQYSIPQVACRNILPGLLGFLCNGANHVSLGNCIWMNLWKLSGKILRDQTSEWSHLHKALKTQKIIILLPFCFYSVWGSWVG